jgi:hypothetical protein
MTLLTTRARVRALTAQIARARTAYAAAARIHQRLFLAELAGGAPGPVLRWLLHMAAIGLWLIKAVAVLATLTSGGAR